MATLLVRNLDDTVVSRLKARARVHGRSAEAEHRAILEAVLRPRGMSGKEFLEIMRSGPKVDLELPDLNEEARVATFD